MNSSSVGRHVFLFLFHVICCSFVAGGIVKKDGTTDAVNKVSSSLPNSSRANSRIFKSSMDSFVNKLFEETDMNEDGMVSFDEAYIGVLLLYVRLNRRAPIPPPSREKFRRIFLKTAGTKKSKELSLLDKDEYGVILKVIVGRALLRLTSHRIVTLMGAPLLTEMIVRSLASRKEGFEATMRFIVPSKFHEAVIPTITSRAFHRGFWMVILVMTLGNTCLAAVTFLLDLSLPKNHSVD